MTINGSYNVTVTARQIIYWWVVYVLLDILFFGILNCLYFIYILPGIHSPLSYFIKIPLYGLLGLFGKTYPIPQFPVMLLLLFVFRKSLLIRKWCWIPLISFLIGYSLLIGFSILFDYSANWEVAREALFRELRSWPNYYRHALNAYRPMALISTLLATVAWIVFLRMKWSTK